MHSSANRNRVHRVDNSSFHPLSLPFWFLYVTFVLLLSLFCLGFVFLLFTWVLVCFPTPLALVVPF